MIHEALKHNAKHFIYSSIDRGGAKSIKDLTCILHFIHKHRIEQHLLKKTKDSNNCILREPDTGHCWQALCDMFQDVYAWGPAPDDGCQ